MESQLVPLTVPPGMFRDGTPYQAKGRWANGSLVRFYEGTKRPVGGWQRLVDGNNAALVALTGTARAMLAWRNVDGTSLLGVGTNSKLYVVSGGALFDVTPAGFTAGTADAAGSVPGNYGGGNYGAGLYGSGATGATPLDPATWTLDIFGSFLVGACTSDNKFYVWSGVPATPAIQPAWTPVFTGSLVTSGSTAANSPTIALTATTLVGTIIAGQTFVISGVTYTAQANATAISNVLTVTVQPQPASIIAATTAVTGTQTQAPTCTAVVTTPERFAVALGAFDSSIGALNSKLVAWASQETTNVWGPLSINTAGNFPLTTTGRLMCGARAKAETLLFTDADVWRMVFTGATIAGVSLVYAFSQAGDQCGIIAPNAKAVVDSGVFWMGRKGFYYYDGFVHPLQSDVADFVFTNLNDLQRAKCWAMPMPQYNEVWWFYPSLAGTEIDSYVIYNYVEQHWTTGSMVRTAGAPQGPIQYPVMIGDSANGSLLWQHEVGSGRLTGNNQAIPFLESGPIEIGAGDNVMKVLRVVPDENTLGDTTLQVAVSMFPTDAFTYGAALTVAQPTDVRLTGRLARLKFTQHNAVDWRIGGVRLGVKLGGRR